MEIFARVWLAKFENKTLAKITAYTVIHILGVHENQDTVEPRYNEVLGTMKITLLYQVSHYIRVKKLRNIKRWDQQNYLVIRGFCYIRPLYNEVPLYMDRLFHSARGRCFLQVLVTTFHSIHTRVWNSLKVKFAVIVMTSFRGQLVTIATASCFAKAAVKSGWGCAMQVKTYRSAHWNPSLVLGKFPCRKQK